MNIALPTAGLIVVKNDKILLAYSKNKKAWYLPGGKIDEGETSKQALIREIEEELNLELEPQRLDYYFHVSAQAYGEAENIIMEQDCYLYDLHEKVEASHEIGAIKYYDLETYKKEPIQVPGVLIVFSKLIEDKKIAR